MLVKEGFDVVISGIGGKFPETNNIFEFQEKLFGKVKLVTEENKRWVPGAMGTPITTGKVLEEYKFDASFFGIHRRLCLSAEPMMKFTLEQSFAAMVDAGLNPFSLKGENIAVIVTASYSESEVLMMTNNGAQKDGLAILGHCQSLISNRVSYFYNFVGPSYTLETSWTGGLTGLEQAASLIRQGVVTAALVTAAYVMWSPSIAKQYVDIDVLTFEDHCCPFDANAKGLIRSDGVITYFLQRKSEANRVYATIVNVDTKPLGDRECGLMKYDAGLERFLTNFYQTSGCDPEQISYLEPDGMSVREMDTIELNSLANAICPKRKSPLSIGSVKGNVGQAHVAASFMSIAKGIIAMETGLIPPTLYYKQPNPDVPALANGDFKVITDNKELTGDLVAINSLSMFGTAGHLVMQRHNKPKRELSPPEGLPTIMLLSARHEEGATMITNMVQSMPLDLEYASLVNNVFKTNVPNHLWRAYVISPPSDSTSNCEISFMDSEKQRPIWFMLSGMGSQWNGMGQELMKIPVFTAAVDKCDKVLKPLGVDIKHILTTDDKQNFDNILHCFVGIATVQIGLLDILRTVGVKADGIIGHSTGEVVCGYADGCLTAEQAVLSAHARGMAVLSGHVVKGLMAAVGLGYDAIKDLLPPSIDVACHNAADSCTISGPWDDIMEFAKILKEKEIFVKVVNTGETPFHSRYISNIADNLREVLKEIIPEPKQRSAKWICTSVPQTLWNSREAQFASAEYYTNNLLNPVLFEEGCGFIPADAVVLEIAPHGLMQAILRRSLGSQTINISLTNRTVESKVKFLLAALGKLHLNKVDLDVNALYPPVEYPVSRGTPSLAPLLTWDHKDTWFQEFIRIINMMYEQKHILDVPVNVNSDDFKLWSEHCVESNIVLPLTQLLFYPWQMLLKLKELDFEAEAIEMENVTVNGRVFVDMSSQNISIGLLRASQNFEVCLECVDNKFEPLVSGQLSVIKRPDLPLAPLYTNGHTAVTVSRSEFYSVMSRHGYQLGPQFQAVHTLCFKGKECEGILTWTGNMVTFLDALFKIVVFIHLKTEKEILEPVSFRKLIIDSPHFYKLPPGTEVQLRYNSKINRLYCEGLQIDGITLSVRQTIPTETSLVWKSVKFIPFSANITKVEDFLRLSVQLITEENLNCWFKKSLSFNCIEVKDDVSKQCFIRRLLNQILSSYPNLSSSVQVKSLRKTKEDLKQDAKNTYLLVGEFSTILSLVKETQEHRNIFFLTVMPTRKALDELELQPILKHELATGETLVLLKQRIDPSKLHVFDMDKMTGLRQFISNSQQPVVIVSRNSHSRQALKTLAMEDITSQIRCVFLDNQSPEFSLNSPLYHQQLSMDLPVNVLSDQKWGFNHSVTMPDIASDNDTLPTLESSVKNLQLNCIALNTKRFTVQSEIPSNQPIIKYVDYCGTKRAGERVMGLGQMDSTKKVIVDPLLCWSVPSHWSSDSAVTVPYVYSLIYYCIYLKAELQTGDSVLVHAGMSPIGRAAIAVSLDLGAVVYVTVSTHSQIEPLLAVYPQLKRSNVFDMESSNFEIEIKKLTKNDGINVVLNCLKGKYINASFRLLSRYSNLINLGDINIEDKEEVYMSRFLGFNRMHGVSLDSIVHAEPELKQQVKELVNRGIKQGVVQPLPHRTFTLPNFSGAVRNLKMRNALEKTVLVNPKEDATFHCNPKDTFIIVGTKRGLWLELAEWLIKNGARNLVIASLKQNLTTNISRKFNSILNSHQATIVMTTISRLDSYQGTEQFLQEATRLGPVAGIFCTYMEESSVQMSNLDAASRRVVPELPQFVCLLGGGTDVCKSRAQHGFSSCLVQTESPLIKPQNILTSLTSILTNKDEHSFMVNEHVSNNERTGSENAIKVVRDYLPNNLQDVESFGQAITDQSLKELITRSPPYKFMKCDLVPVFVIPGVHSSRLFPLTRQLMHPAFSPTSPPCLPTLNDSAQLLIQNLLQVQSRGPYNVLADTWSGTLALHVAAQLEAQGHQVKLFLVEAEPFINQKRASAFCLPSGDFSNSKFLCALLNLPQTVAKDLDSLLTWNEQVQHAVKYIGSEKQFCRESVVTALTSLRLHLTALLRSLPPEHPFQGDVHVFQTKHTKKSGYSHLKTYCGKSLCIHIMEDETSTEIFKNPRTAATINENLAISMDL